MSSIGRLKFLDFSKKVGNIRDLKKIVISSFPTSRSPVVLSAIYQIFLHYLKSCDMHMVSEKVVKFCYWQVNTGFCMVYILCDTIYLSVLLSFYRYPSDIQDFEWYGFCKQSQCITASFSYLVNDNP